MATQIQTIETLPLICWKSQPVITTELLAAVYEVQEKQIWQNFSNNKDRFTKGKHHHKLTGSELKEFKNCIENFEAVRIAPRTPNLTLWTERGTVRHAKMLGTDTAWEVQDKLEEFYFARKAEEAQPKPLRTQVLALDYVDRITASLPRLGDAAMQQLYSEASEIDLGRRLIPLPVIKEKHYTATEIAGELGVSVQRLGRIANSHSLKTEEFGEFRLSKSRHNSKQVEQFYYNKRGREAIQERVKSNDQVKGYEGGNHV